MKNKETKIESWEERFLEEFGKEYIEIITDGMGIETGDYDFKSDVEISDVMHFIREELKAVLYELWREAVKDNNPKRLMKIVNRLTN